MGSDARCGLCGEPMPPGEEMFKFHGYSGPCPKKELAARLGETRARLDTLRADEAEHETAPPATRGEAAPDIIRAHGVQYFRIDLTNHHNAAKCPYCTPTPPPAADLVARPKIVCFCGSFDFRAHLQRQREFSERTFGPGPRTAGVVDHIRKELREIEADPSDISEWIDVAILAFDGAWRAGYTPDTIIEALVAKQTKNEMRTWPDWRTASPDKAIEHDRSAAPARREE